MINSININNLEEFNNLGLQVNDNFINVFDLDKLLKSDYDSIYGYYIDSKLVGFIHVSKLYEVLDIVNIVVDSEYRSKKIGTKLLNYVVDKYKDIDSIMLEVNENNTIAIDFYKKNNFEVINIRKNYYKDGNALIMKRDV